MRLEHNTGLSGCLQRSVHLTRLDLISRSFVQRKHHDCVRYHLYRDGNTWRFENRKIDVCERRADQKPKSIHE